ncbi:tripartite tricarboxylate transporter TctB family protein [uncultured Ruegeria sp.]|uniref:tripartite tricarboxylate transporter TctB family protein n=1 Tax=uncultured Ruegeria sp. TaxID=259304 RepID=UPI002606175D|nr:tripartite tricarboxylate transporter TctB family protein [uncultured Ruegeria sp.]
MKYWVIEAIALVLFLGLGIASIVAATQITGFSFDPLGSKSAPYVVGGFTVALSVAAGLILLRGLSRDPEAMQQESANEADDASEKRDYTALELLEVLGLFVVAIFYVLALFKFRLPFSIATIVFLLTAACLLERTLRGRIPIIALIAGAIIGIGGELLFTKVFFIDLPSLW